MSIWIISPSIGAKIKNVWNHHLAILVAAQYVHCLSLSIQRKATRTCPLSLIWSLSSSSWPLSNLFCWRIFQWLVIRDPCSGIWFFLEVLSTVYSQKTKNIAYPYGSKYLLRRYFGPPQKKVPFPCLPSSGSLKNHRVWFSFLVRSSQDSLGRPWANFTSKGYSFKHIRCLEVVKINDGTLDVSFHWSCPFLNMYNSYLTMCKKSLGKKHQVCNIST